MYIYFFVTESKEDDHVPFSTYIYIHRHIYKLRHIYIYIYIRVQGYPLMLIHHQVSTKTNSSNNNSTIGAKMVVK